MVRGEKQSLEEKFHKNQEQPLKQGCFFEIHVLKYTYNGN